MVRKLAKLFLLFVFLIVLIPVVDLAYCRAKMSVAIDYDDELEYREGRVYQKGAAAAFTGKAYQTMCGDDCGLFGCYAIHWYASFKDGYRDGEVLLPNSERSNDYFSMSLFFGDYKSVYFLKGVRT
ncbi:hypothetical protein [Parathalassolituus penaei]|uniref:Uncharacterized protein n=1 Tax=Parathalassolituus penaei TaxID=2997323 RepID=A0A9X3EGV8_9GAMM|nr:hypothetical protein [Parathalassolituus penaei]MCY0964081.1 hypothetical protein [Parathalassolituus penaei]